MKRLSIVLIVLAFALTGCAGMQINWNIDKQALAEIAACEIGFQFSKHYPEEAQVALKYARIAIQAGEAGSFNDQLNEWKEYLLEYIGADPHYARQLSKLLPEIELSEDALPDMKWMETVKPYISEFIMGIEEGLPVIISNFPHIRYNPIKHYMEVHDANYLKFLWARGLP